MIRLEGVIRSHDLLPGQGFRRLFKTITDKVNSAYLPMKEWMDYLNLDRSPHLSLQAPKIR